MSDLVVIAFPTEAKAEEVRQKLLGMQKEYLLELGDAVVAVKDAKGNIKLNQMINTTAAGAVGGAFWGTLIGLIFLMPLAGAALGAASGAVGGALTDVGINDKFMKDTAAAIQPGTAALFVLVRKVTADKVLEGLKGEGGTVLKTSLDHTKETALQAALASVQAAVPARLPEPAIDGLDSMSSGERRNEYPNWSLLYERSTSRAEKLSDAAAGWVYVAHFLTVADVERSLRFYETVFGGRILSRGDSSGAPGYIQIANTWLLVNPGGGPTPDKPSVTLSVPANPDLVSSFMNIRVADIQACYKLWRSRGAEFITEPKPKYGETRCYIRDPDGYIIEVGQSNPGVAYG